MGCLVGPYVLHTSYLAPLISDLTPLVLLGNVEPAVPCWIMWSPALALLGNVELSSALLGNVEPSYALLGNVVSSCRVMRVRYRLLLLCSVVCA